MPKETPLVKGIIGRSTWMEEKKEEEEGKRSHQNETTPHGLCWGALTQTIEKQTTVTCHLKTGYILRNASWGQLSGYLLAPILNSGHWGIRFQHIWSSYLYANNWLFNEGFSQGVDKFSQDPCGHETLRMAPSHRDGTADVTVE